MQASTSSNSTGFLISSPVVRRVTFFDLWRYGQPQEFNIQVLLDGTFTLIISPFILFQNRFPQGHFMHNFSKFFRIPHTMVISASISRRALAHQVFFSRTLVTAFFSRPDNYCETGWVGGGGGGAEQRGRAWVEGSHTCQSMMH